MGAGDPRGELLRQLVDWVDERVVGAVGSVPREAFVPAAVRHHAWEDRPLPIGARQTISQPSLVAKMCELLDLDSNDRVLDVGTGSGYHAAVLSRLCAHVYSIERHRSLSELAAHNLTAAGIHNVTLLVGDGAAGHADHAPYDAINVAAVSEGGVPPALEQQLARDGRLVVPVDGADQQLLLIRRHDGSLEHSKQFPVRFVPLVRDEADDQVRTTER